LKAQVTLTVAAAKEIIAEGIMHRSDFQYARENAKLLFKGGTTVSVLAEKIGLPPLRISGRISPNGAKSSGDNTAKNAHSLLVCKEHSQNIDDVFPEVTASLTSQDVVIIGANALGDDGCAGILVGSPLGGMPGQCFSGLMAQGCKIIIACGLEKRIPGKIAEACQAAGINRMEWSMGMSCGLVPLLGEVVTEQTALEDLFGVKAVSIASGGIDGAEGSITWILEGMPTDVKRAVELVIRASSAKSPALEECRKGSSGCARHKNCAWRKSGGGKLSWYEK
jgi:hypothetical protein